MRSVALALLVQPRAVLGAADTKCEVLFGPYGVTGERAKTGGYGATSPSPAAPANTCPATKPASYDDAATSADNAVGAGAANIALCCSTGAKCNTMYVNNGLTPPTGKVACANTGEEVPPTFVCPTVSTASPSTVSAPACSAAAATTFAALDKEFCCRVPCAKGFQLSGTSATKQVCSALLSTKKTFQLSTASTGYCSMGSAGCVAADANTCCQLKCTDKYQVKGAGEKDADGTAKTECPADTFVSQTAFCADGSCSDATANQATCCVQKCSDGFEIVSGTSTTKKNCATGERVSTTKFCASTSCGTSDATTCCDMKCDDAKNGFTISTGTTTSQQCPEKTLVHTTEYCDGRSCGDATDKSTCCQQKCGDGFKLKGATGTTATQPMECGEGLTVLTTALCKGSSCAGTDAGTCCQQTCAKGFKEDAATTDEPNMCAKGTTVGSETKCAGSPCGATDAATCCNMLCTDADAGFKVKGGSTKQKLECAAGQAVSSKRCSGTCAATDSVTCCMTANNSSTTAGSNRMAEAVTVTAIATLLFSVTV